jgi:hypothetical protein
MNLCSGEFHDQGDARPVREGVSKEEEDGRRLPTLWVGHPPNGLTAVWGVARPQGGRPAAVFFPLGYPFPYGPGNPLYVGVC